MSGRGFGSAPDKHRRDARAAVPLLGEDLCDFVERTEESGVPASLRRYAWLANISPAEAQENWERLCASQAQPERASKPGEPAP